MRWFALVDDPTAHGIRRRRRSLGRHERSTERGIVLHAVQDDEDVQRVCFQSGDEKMLVEETERVVRKRGAGDDGERG